MEDIRLPIDIIPGTDPPRFRWRQTVNTPNGRQVVDHEGQLPPAVEVAVSRIIVITKQLLHDNAVMQGTIKGLTKKLESAAAIASRQAETVPSVPPKKGKV